jgi:DNA-binding response OmpR family regulator
VAREASGPVRPSSQVGDSTRRAFCSLGYFGCFLGRTRTLDSHASRLRRKLNAKGETAYVLNVWGVGYRLVASTA